MTLSEYHQNYQNRSDDKIVRRMAVKRLEMEDVIKRMSFVPDHGPVKIGILGCGDRRFVQAHRELFESLLSKSVELTTFDITIEHLSGEEGVVEHDVTTPLPGGPFDLLLGHVLLKFIPTEKQWSVIKNAYSALTYGGIAIFVQGKQELEYSDRVENYQAHDAFQYKLGHLNPVKIDDLKDKLTDAEIEFKSWDSLIEGIEAVPITANVLAIKK
ncbi:MAG: hypothetical protein HQ488_03515 [Parcubacteria group bacterium]|nr:hypothetical protein [Parcubacteria group bacterium]